jgi:hypothetical protein
MLLLAAPALGCCMVAWSKQTHSDPFQPTQSRVLHRPQSPKLLPAFGDQYISLSIPLITPSILPFLLRLILRIAVKLTAHSFHLSLKQELV